MVSYAVTPDEVALTGTAAGSTAELIEGTLHDLKMYILGLGTEWRGAASTDFQTLMENWDIHAKNLNIALMDIAEGLGYNAAGYLDFEQTNRANINGITSALPPLAI